MLDIDVIVRIYDSLKPHEKKVGLWIMKIVVMSLIAVMAGIFAIMWTIWNNPETMPLWSGLVNYLAYGLLLLGVIVILSPIISIVICRFLCGNRGDKGVMNKEE